MKQRLLPIIATGVIFLIIGLSLGELLAIELNLTTTESVRSNSALSVLAAIFGATGMFQYRQRDQATRAKREIECRIGRVFVSATWALDFLYSTPENAVSARRKRMHAMLQMFEETRTAMAGLSASNPQLIAAHRHLDGISTSAFVALVDKRVPDWEAGAREAIQALQSDIVAAKKFAGGLKTLRKVCGDHGRLFSARSSRNLDDSAGISLIGPLAMPRLGAL